MSRKEKYSFPAKPEKNKLYFQDLVENLEKNNKTFKLFLKSAYNNYEFLGYGKVVKVCENYFSLTIGSNLINIFWYDLISKKYKIEV